MNKQQLIRGYVAISMLTAFGASLSMSTYVSFLLSKGLNLFQVNLVNAVYFGTVLVMEIATGAFADNRGRKKSFLVFCVLRLMVCPLIYAFSGSVSWFMIAEFVGALGATFASGAYKAWFVDELHAMEGTSEEQKKAFGTSAALSSLVASPLASILGGWLGSHNLAWPWFASTICGVIAFFVSNKIMTERNFMPLEKESILTTARKGWQVVRASQILLTLMGTGAVWMFAIQAPNMQWQPMFRPLLINQTQLGLLGAGIHITLGIGAWLARDHFPRLHPNTLLTLILVGIGIGIAITGMFGATTTGLVVFLLHEIARGAYSPLYDHELHKEAPSKQRATIDSFSSTIRHFGGLVGLLVGGWLSVHVGMHTTWIISGTVLAVVGTVFWKFRK